LMWANWPPLSLVHSHTLGKVEEVVISLPIPPLYESNVSQSRLIRNVID